MRLSSLQVTLTKSHEAPAQEPTTMRQWWHAIKPWRTPHWRWTDLPAEQVRQGVQSVIADHGENARGLGLMMSALLYERPEGAQAWSWVLPVGQGKTIAFTGEAFIAEPSTPATETPAVRMTLIAETQADKARLALLGVLDRTARISPEAMRHTLNDLPSPSSDTPAPATLADIPAEAFQTQMARIAEAWPDKNPLVQLFLLAGPLAMWVGGVNEQANTVEWTLKGLTSTTQVRPPHAACRLTVTCA